MNQNAKAESPPERKLAVPVLIYCHQAVSFLGSVELSATKHAVDTPRVDCLEDGRIHALKPKTAPLRVSRNTLWNIRSDARKRRTSKERNIQRKFARNARLPVNPVHRPSTPFPRTICRAQSIGPLYCLSATERWYCIWSLTTRVKKKVSDDSAEIYVRFQDILFRCSMGVAKNALYAVRSG